MKVCIFRSPKCQRLGLKNTPKNQNIENGASQNNKLIRLHLNQSHCNRFYPQSQVLEPHIKIEGLSLTGSGRINCERSPLFSVERWHKLFSGSHLYKLFLLTLDGYSPY